MSRRSLLKVGDGGLAITVPKGWAEYYGLQAGDRVEMVADAELHIRPPKVGIKAERKRSSREAK